MAIPAVFVGGPADGLEIEVEGRPEMRLAPMRKMPTPSPEQLDGLRDRLSQSSYAYRRTRQVRHGRVVYALVVTDS